MDDLETTAARLGRVVQAALGEKLRAQYDCGRQNLPEGFVHLLRRFGNGPGPPLDASFRATPEQAQLVGSFDPETIGRLQRALEDGWGALCHIGNQTISQETLAGRILELAEAGERDSARLATQAVTSLIMQGQSL
jgi:hypothetical protein